MAYLRRWVKLKILWEQRDDFPRHADALIAGNTSIRDARRLFHPVLLLHQVVACAGRLKWGWRNNRSRYDRKLRIRMPLESFEKRAIQTIINYTYHLPKVGVGRILQSCRIFLPLFWRLEESRILSEGRTWEDPSHDLIWFVSNPCYSTYSHTEFVK